MKQFLNYLAIGLGIGLWLFLIKCYDNRTSTNYREQVLEHSDRYEIGEGDHVFICNGTNSHAYHSYTECGGLKSCRATVEEVTFDWAENDERTPCHYCVK